MVVPEQTALGKKMYPVLEGFELTAPPAYPRLVTSIWGAEKTGKTSFGLTFPEPRLYMNLDFGLKELFISRPELVGSCQHIDIQMNELTDPETWGDLLVKFHDAYLRALAYADEHQGTVIVDTATQLWQVVQAVKIEHARNEKLAKAEARNYPSPAARDAAIERATKGSQLDWQQANAFMGGLMRRASHVERASAVFINRARPEYGEGGRPTGAMEYHGFGELPAITQVHLQFMKIGGKHVARVDRCRFDTSLEGLDIENPTYDLVRAFVLGE